jgi:hypothetical protein
MSMEERNEDVASGRYQPDPEWGTWDVEAETAEDAETIACEQPQEGGWDDSGAEERRTAVVCSNGHEWVVYNTALREGWLMTQCVNCGAMETIDDPSPEEWSAAFHAPSRPYHWSDSTRVTERGYGAPRVIRATHGPRCACPSQQSLPESQGCDRIPGGIWVHPDRLSDEEKAELIDFADFVGESDLCSRLLPAFIRHVESDSAERCYRVIRAIVDRIEEFDFVGLHCSPPVVARIIREYASWESQEREGTDVGVSALAEVHTSLSGRQAPADESIEQTIAALEEAARELDV